MAAIMQQLQAWVSASGILADKMAVIMIIALFGLMVVGLVLGQELAFVLGGAGVIIGWLAWGGPGVTIAMTKIYDQMQSYSMVAIPMFVLMANFLTHSKVADGLFESIRYLLGPLKGGLGLAVILVSTVFAATTGIVGASVVTMGMLSLPVLLRSGYKPSLACGMVCAGGSLGILIPPSIMLVSMGSYAEVSVGKIFFAAITPGLMLSLCYIIYLMVVCRIHPDWGPAMSAEELAEMPLKKRISGSLINLIPPLILIFAVLGSIFGGIATPTEAAGMGAIFALILAIFYKQFSWEMMKESLIDTAKTTAMVFIILFGAAAFTGVFMSLDGDQIIADWVLGMGIGKWGAFAIMCVIVFILGMFIDWLGIVMIVFPIFLPIMDQFGFDRLWLVAVIATLLQTCFMTPPFGFALFYVKGILPGDIKIQEVYKGVIPFIIIICIVTVLCAVFPPLVTWLPSLLAACLHAKNSEGFILRSFFYSYAVKRTECSLSIPSFADSVANAGMNDLADVPKVCSLLRCGQPFFRRVVADVGRLCAAVQTGYVNAPACFILHGADAAADGAVFQLNFVYLIHGKISFAFMPVIA